MEEEFSREGRGEEGLGEREREGRGEEGLGEREREKAGCMKRKGKKWKGGGGARRNRRNRGKGSEYIAREAGQRRIQD